MKSRKAISKEAQLTILIKNTQPECLKELIDQHKNKFNVFHYSACISVYAIGNMPNEALDVFRQMRKANIQPNEKAYTSLINAFARGDMPNEALGVLRQMRDANIQPDEKSYTSLINAFARGDMPDEALGVFDQMVKAGIEPDEISYTSLINAENIRI